MELIMEPNRNQTEFKRSCTRTTTYASRTKNQTMATISFSKSIQTHRVPMCKTYIHDIYHRSRVGSVNKGKHRTNSFLDGRHLFGQEDAYCIDGATIFSQFFFSSRTHLAENKTTETIFKKGEKKIVDTFFLLLFRFIHKRKQNQHLLVKRAAIE